MGSTPKHRLGADGVGTLLSLKVSPAACASNVFAKISHCVEDSFFLFPLMAVGAGDRGCFFLKELVRKTHCDEENKPLHNNEFGARESGGHHRAVKLSPCFV